MSIQWFFKRAGKCYGPYTAKEFRQLAESGQVTPDDHVRRDGMPEHEWVLGSKIDGLFPKDSAPPTKET
jgi:hypothetical protein